MHITFSNGMPNAPVQIIPLELTAPQATPAPATVKECLAALEAIEGQSHWSGAMYYASTADLELARLRTARRLAGACEVARQIYLEKARLFRDGATHCAFCQNSIVELRRCRAVGKDLLHLSCAERFDADMRSWIRSHVEITDAGRAALEDERVAQ
jgi:hypothetical protein